MIMKIKTIALISLFLCIGSGIAPLTAQMSMPLIQAEKQESEGDFMILSGNVEINWEEYTIYADYLRFNTKTKEITAQGRVTMSSNETVLSGERLQFNLETKKGVMFDTHGQMPPTVSYKTNRMEQIDNDTLKFKKLDFSSCSQCVPRWKLTCTGGKIKKEKYIEMKNAVLKVKKIPLFYIPYIRYPLNKNGRATGFLFPGIGRSDRRGFFLLNSFFWAVKPNVDLTLSLDYYGKAGIGAAQEFRYLFKGMQGNVKYYYFKYKDSAILGPDEEPVGNEFYSRNKSDYLLNIEHKQRLNFLNTRIIVTVDKQSDANFLRLFSNDFDSVLRRVSKSSVNINSSYKNIKLSLSAMQTDTYYTFNNRSRTLRYLPKITLNWNQQKIWKVPGYFSLNANYSDMTRQGKSYDLDDTIYLSDVNSKRLNLNPSYTLKLLTTPWLNAKATVTSKNSFYPKSLDPETGESVDEPLHLVYNTANVELKGPIFNKIYEFKNSKIKHLIVPSVKMRYATKVKEEDRARLMPVDNFDYPLYSYVGFTLTNRLLYKGQQDTSAREILSHIISQEYYFDPELAHRYRKINDTFPAFSELKNTLRLRLFKYFNIDASASFNHSMDADKFLDNFSRMRLSIAYNNRKSFFHGNFFFNRFINVYAAPGYIFNRDSIGGNAYFDVTGFPIKLDANVNYDITDKLFRNATFKLTYDYQCIQFNAEMRLYRFQGRTETQFNIGVNFGYMGMVKDFLGTDKR
jgi:LPS-assembly protein